MISGILVGVCGVCGWLEPVVCWYAFGDEITDLEYAWVGDWINWVEDEV
jgi:hypothetical protein